jgi:hypothetical protein
MYHERIEKGRRRLKRETIQIGNRKRGGKERIEGYKEKGNVYLKHKEREEIKKGENMEMERRMERKET